MCFCLFLYDRDRIKVGNFTAAPESIEASSATCSPGRMKMMEGAGEEGGEGEGMAGFAMTIRRRVLCVLYEKR